jgi:hypothetical protein
LQQGGFERSCGEDLEVAPTELRVRVFAGDDLALLGDAMAPWTAPTGWARIA